MRLERGSVPVFKFLLLFFLITTSLSAEEPKYLGVGTCASSNCHGQVTGSATSNVLRNEFSTWHKFDRHATSYKTLLSAESKRIAYHLGLGEPHKEKMCLDCHATNSANVGERYTLEDGVGCESCHGASEKWVKPHVEAGATHLSNIKNGLRDLTDLKVRAAVCVSCHYGDEKREITHTLYGAGHPRVSFELDTYEAVMPRHWRMDADYAKRKFEYSSTDGWLAGQKALASAQDAFIERHAQSSGPFPEFAQYTCFSCHQPLDQKSFISRLKTDHTGLPELNKIHSEILALGEKNPNPRGLIQSLRNYVKDSPNIDFQRAEQVVMGIASANEQAKMISKDRLKKIYKAVEDPKTFNQKHFRALIQ